MPPSGLPVLFTGYHIAMPTSFAWKAPVTLDEGKMAAGHYQSQENKMTISEIIAQVREGKITAAKAAEQIADQTANGVLERMKPYATPAHRAWAKIAFGRHNIPFFGKDGVSENLDENSSHPAKLGVRALQHLEPQFKKQIRGDGDESGIVTSGDKASTPIAALITTHHSYKPHRGEQLAGASAQLWLHRNEDGSHHIHAEMLPHDGTAESKQHHKAFAGVLKQLGHNSKGVGPKFDTSVTPAAASRAFTEHIVGKGKHLAGVLGAFTDAVNPEAASASRKEAKSKSKAAATAAKAAELAKAAKKPAGKKKVNNSAEEDPVENNLDERAKPYAAAPFARTKKRVFNKAIPLYVPDFADKITHDQKPILVTKSMMETMAITASLHGHDHPYQDQGVKENDVFVVLEGDKFVTIKAGTLTPLMEGATVEEVVNATAKKMAIGTAFYGVDVEGELTKIADVGNKGTNESCEGDAKEGAKVTFKGITFMMNKKGQWCSNGECVPVDSPLCHKLDQAAGK